MQNLPQSQPETNREKRNSVIVRAAVSFPGTSSIERRVRNLSRSGACVEHEGEMQPGATVLLQIGALNDLAAEVMWVTERLAGLRFAEPIDLEEARKPRGAGIKPQVGWIAEINDAYRR